QVAALVDSPAAGRGLLPRPSLIRGRFTVEGKLSEQPRETRGVSLARAPPRASARLAEAIGVNRPMYGDCLSRPLRPVPSLSGKRQQPDVMLVQDRSRAARLTTTCGFGGAQNVGAREVVVLIIVMGF